VCAWPSAVPIHSGRLFSYAKQNSHQACIGGSQRSVLMHASQLVRGRARRKARLHAGKAVRSERRTEVKRGRRVKAMRGRRWTGMTYRTTSAFARAPRQAEYRSLHICLIVPNYVFLVLLILWFVALLCLVFNDLLLIWGLCPRQLCYLLSSSSSTMSSWSEAS
jgi:hypothetical protein